MSVLGLFWPVTALAGMRIGDDGDLQLTINDAGGWCN